MMSTAFEGQRLPVGFTFRIVEIAKRLKIQPMPRTTAAPWGMSLAVGIIIAVMSMSPYVSSIDLMAPPVGSPLPSEMKVLKMGQISVDVLDVSQIPVIAQSACLLR